MNAREAYELDLKRCGYCRRRHERTGEIVWCKRHVTRSTITRHRYKIIDDKYLQEIVPEADK